MICICSVTSSSTDTNPPMLSTGISKSSYRKLELWFGGHTQEPLPLIALVIRMPRRITILALRAGMAVATAASVFGMYEHFSSNLAFERDIRPSASNIELINHALHGAVPMLAPGILALAALLAAAATYRHPALLERD